MGNKFDERYIIRMADYNDIDRIMEFLDLYWRKGHIMSKDRHLFEYEFLEGNDVNVTIAIDRNTNQIEAIAGFLPCSKRVNGKRDIWGSFWKVNSNNHNIAFLGIEIMKRQLEMSDCREHLAVGLNPNTSGVIRRNVFKENVQKMNHFYLLNEDIKDFRIAVINEMICRNFDTDEPSQLKLYDKVSDIKKDINIENLNLIPYKDFWYIEKRYFKHPYYEYQVYGVSREDETKALMVTREAEYEGRKALRIVDYIGEQKYFSGLGRELKEILKKNNYEYIDFYNWGFNEGHLYSAGFVLKDENDKNVIPNYFEPFEQKNVDIWVGYSCENALFCKADGDQDRPNIIKNDGKE